MLRCLASQGLVHVSHLSHVAKSSLVKSLYTLGIETSCDDTSVAILETLQDPNAPAQSQSVHASLLFHEKVTADSRQYGGIHPIAALGSHQANLGRLLARALSCFRREASTNLAFKNVSTTSRRASLDDLKPDLVAVTRGPGMRSNLSVGLDTAKGLALAWSVPLIAVNHMQAHTLTPRLVTALSSTPPSDLTSSDALLPPIQTSMVLSDTSLISDRSSSPSFPFLSLLVSGGHTLLLKSVSLTQHFILATTSDIALGDALDKIARNVLPPNILQSLHDTAYARALENFVFLDGTNEYAYIAPVTRKAELERRKSSWGWTLGVPLAKTRSGSKSKSMEFCFTGLDSSVRRITLQRKEELGDDLSVEERRDLGREAMRVAFEHLASRVCMALQEMKIDNINGKDSIVDTLVVSGGVASNGFLRTVLRRFLDARSFPHVKLSFPPVDLCTDNAAMIAWTGYEMFSAGYESELGCRAIRKWSLDETAHDGGILGVDGWKKSEDGEDASS